jgi:hypothetical protein
VRMVLDTNILIAALITKGTPPDSLESSSLTGLHSGEAFPPGIGDAIRVAALRRWTRKEAESREQADCANLIDLWATIRI